MTREPHIGDLMVYSGHIVSLDTEAQADELIAKLAADGKIGEKYKNGGRFGFYWFVLLVKEKR
ncbi:MAG: hypothetical protein ABL889_16990 [Terricaulis sp.]